MTRTTRRFLLGMTIAVMAIFLAAFLFDRDVMNDPVRPNELDALARHVADHPADWLAISVIADQALDSNLPKRAELWRAAYAHASALAPRRPNPSAAFVRGGLFHWYELNADDRKRVLAAAAPLLHDEQTFNRLHKSLWELTRDLDYLRANAPRNERALQSLATIAVTNGRFDVYRALRDELARRRLEAFEAQRAVLSPPQLLSLLPPKLTKADEPLVRRVLEELQRRPLDALNASSAAHRASEVIPFAIRHGLRPLDGLEAILETQNVAHVTRARLAIALGKAQQAAAIELAGSRIDAQWAQYFAERAAFEEGRSDRTMAAQYRRRAALAAGEPEPGRMQWNGICGRDEICNVVTTVARGPLTLKLENAQSDETPPYVEIYVDDALVAEAPVEDAKTFALDTAAWQRVEVRLANPLTRNRYQRRVRLS